MCACRQKKSFLIADILSDTKKKPYKNLSNEPAKPLVCNEKVNEIAHLTEFNQANEVKAYDDKFIKFNVQEIRKVKQVTEVNQATEVEAYDDKLTRFNVHSEVRNEMELHKINLDQRRHTYPLYPMAMKPNYLYRKESMGFVQSLDPRFSYYSDPVVNSSHILRSQLAANRFVPQLPIPYGFNRGSNCCGPWWGVGGRRKGGQVRFTAAQTGALERRFNASKYLSPDERRALANTLRLSDRQVKTWFQNRRAKWRRTAPESADAGSPPTNDEGSDDEVQIADD